jgi:hypothetical protein
MVREEAQDVNNAYGILTFNGLISNVQLEASSMTDKYHVHKHQ